MLQIRVLKLFYNGGDDMRYPAPLTFVVARRRGMIMEGLDS